MSIRPILTAGLLLACGLTPAFAKTKDKPDPYVPSGDPVDCIYQIFRKCGQAAFARRICTQKSNFPYFPHCAMPSAFSRHQPVNVGDHFAVGSTRIDTGSLILDMPGVSTLATRIWYSPGPADA